MKRFFLGFMFSLLLLAGCSDVPEITTGSIKGKVTLDNSTTESYGFTVSVAGTSYSAVTNKDGSYVIDFVPAGKDYDLVITKGTYSLYIDADITVVAGEETLFETKNITKSEITPETEGSEAEKTEEKNQTTEKTEEKNQTTDTKITSDVTTYKINYVLNGGTANPNAPNLYYSGSSCQLLSPTKTDYVFLGWYKTSDFSGDKIEYIGASTTSDITLYAKWEKGLLMSFAEFMQFITDGVSEGEYNVFISDEYPCITLMTEIPSKQFSNIIINLSLELTKLVSIELNNFGLTWYTHDFPIKSIRLPSTLIYIEQKGLSRLSLLEELYLPDSVLILGNYAFSGCESLKTVRLSNNLKIIEGAFGGCSSLEEIDIPASVEYIGTYCFSGCTSLNSISFKNTENWYYGTETDYKNKTGTELDVTNPENNATFFTTNTDKCVWRE